MLKYGRMKRLTAFVVVMFAVSVAGESHFHGIVDGALMSWSIGDRALIKGALEAAPTTVSTERALREFLEEVATEHGVPPLASEQGALVVAETIKVAAREGAAGNRVDSTEDRQYVDAITAATAWLRMRRDWLPGGVPDDSLARFQAEIEAARANPLNLGFQVALPPSLHIELMETWGEELEELVEPGESAFREKFGLMLLNPATTPAWEWDGNEQRSRDAVTAILRRYLEIRQELAIDRLPAYSAVKAARDALFEARRRLQVESGPELAPAGFQSHEALLEQEILWLASAALKGDAQFTICPDESGAYSLGESHTLPVPAWQQRVEVLIDSRPHRGDGGKPFILEGVVLREGGRIRLEFVARVPAVGGYSPFGESVGWTLVRDGEALSWLPGLRGVSEGVMHAGPGLESGGEIDCGFLEWGLMRTPSWSLRNLANLDRGEVAGGSGSTLSARWVGEAPWLFMAQIARAEYSTQASDDGVVVNEARLFDAATEELAATVAWRNPGRTASGAQYFAEVEIALEPLSLQGLWRSNTNLVDDTPVAPKRSILYHFVEASVAGTPVVVPSSFAVLGPDKSSLLEMRFEAPEAIEDVRSVPRDPLATLAVPRDLASLAFYGDFKDYYYRYLAAPGEHQKGEVAKWVERFGNVRELASAQNDPGIALRSQMIVNGSSLYGRTQEPDWKVEFFRTLDMVDAYPERDVGWENYALIMQRAYSVDEPEFVSEVERRFTRFIVDRFRTDEALARGIDYGYVYGLPCLSAVEVKSVDPFVLLQARIGKARSLAFIAQYAWTEKESWKLAHCDAYLKAARDTLTRAEAEIGPGSPDALMTLVTDARQAIQQSELRLKEPAPRSR